MSKVIKEIIMMLLICLAVILLFAVAFYKFIPSRKDVAEVVQYTGSEPVSAAKADDIDKRNDQVVLTYEVTSSDLNNYKYKKEYVPGKANPFAMILKDAESTATTNSVSGGTTTTTPTTTTNSQSSTIANTENTQTNTIRTNTTTTNTTTNTLIENKGTK